MIEPDWVSSRIDLRRAYRWERARVALGANLLFLAMTGIFGWFGVPRQYDPLVASALVGLLLLIGWAKLQSFVEASRRKQLDELARSQNLKGHLVRCRYFLDGLELGADNGMMGREGGILRFEGETSRFSLPFDRLLRNPDLDARNPKLEMLHAGQPYRVEIIPDKEDDVVGVATLLNRWLRDGGPLHETRFPPTTPEARTRAWYFERSMEHYQLGFGLFFLVATAGRHAFPESYGNLRVAILFLPVVWLGLASLLYTFRLRRDEEVWRARHAQSPVLQSALSHSDERTETLSVRA